MWLFVCNKHFAVIFLIFDFTVATGWKCPDIWKTLVCKASWIKCMSSITYSFKKFIWPISNLLSWLPRIKITSYYSISDKKRKVTFSDILLIAFLSWKVSPRRIIFFILWSLIVFKIFFRVTFLSLILGLYTLSLIQIWSCRR